MNDRTCEGCNTTVKRWEAVERGDGRVVHYWHRDCFTVEAIAAATERVAAFA